MKHLASTDIIARYVSKGRMNSRNPMIETNRSTGVKTIVAKIFRNRFNSIITLFYSPCGIKCENGMRSAYENAILTISETRLGQTESK